jgi:hypothetical protein
MYYKRQTRDIKAMSGMDQAFNLAKALREIPSPPSKIPEYRQPTTSTGTSPLAIRVASTSPTATMGSASPMEGRSIATELRMKIQKEREEEAQRDEDQDEEGEMKPPVPPRSASRSAPSGSPGPGSSELTRSPVPVASPALFITNTDNDSDDDADDRRVSLPRAEEQDGIDQSNNYDIRASTGNDTVAKEASTAEKDEEEVAERQSTIAPDHPNERVVEETPKEKASEKVLLASPIPLEETRPSQITVPTPTTSRSPSISVDPPAETPTPTQERSMYSPTLDLPNANMIDLPPRFSPDMRTRDGAGSPWSPSSPASPHSVTATRHAVQVGRSVSEGQPSGKMPTLVGKTEGSLLGSKGPVPITFLVDGAGIHRSSPSPAPVAREGLGLGMPSTSLMGRISPVNSSPGAGVGSFNPNARRAATSPLAGGESPRPHILGPDPDSRFPAPNPLPTPEVRQTYTPVTAPVSPEMSNTARMSAIYPRKTRSRSFGATMARAMGRGKKDKEKDKVPDIPLSIDTKSAQNGNGGGMKSAPIGGLSIANMPPPSPGSSFSSHMPPSPGGSTHTRHEWKRAESPISIRNGEVPPPRRPSAPAIIHSAPTAPGPPVLPPPIPLTKTTTIDSQNSLSPTLHQVQSRTPSFNSKKKQSSPAGISHTDFAEATIKANGLDFEIVQPRSKRDLLSPVSTTNPLIDERPGMSRSDTTRSDVSGISARSLPLPETDEWGFLKDSSPTPEMYMSRNMGSDHRVAEGKWVCSFLALCLSLLSLSPFLRLLTPHCLLILVPALFCQRDISRISAHEQLTIVSSPIPAEGAPKKIRKLASESGIPASLRGKVWAWFLGPLMPRREAGRFEELVKSSGPLDERTEIEINR